LETIVPDAKWLQEKVKSYIALSDEEARYFYSFFKKKVLKNREVLLETGQPCNYFSLVVDGCLMNSYTDQNGFEHVLQFATSTWWTADLNSFINEVPSNYSIRALMPSVILQISKSGLEELFKKIPATEKYFRIIYQNALIAHQQRIMRDHAYDAESRYQLFREKYPDLENLVPLKYIASYLGITPEFLSKIRRRLSRKK
jgi:CRP-like cAMP-binding protein